MATTTLVYKEVCMEFVPKGFTPNHRRADSIFAYLIGAYNDRVFPYTEDNLGRRPQNQVPREQRGNANFWFYLTHMMRGRLESHTAAAQVVRLYQRRPDLFDPAAAAKLTEDEIHKELEAVFGTIPRKQNFSRAWRRNSEILLAWDGNILNVYKGVATEVEVRARITNKGKPHLPLQEQGFFCFQDKMCSLLTYFLMYAGLVPKISMSPPMDFHHMRAMIGTGIIPLPSGRYSTDAIHKLADQVGREYLKRYPEMDPVEFADLLFILSREGCTRAITEPNINWRDKKTVNQHARTCGSCPVEHKCGATALTESYYTKGGADSPKARVIHIVPRPRAPRRLR